MIELSTNDYEPQVLTAIDRILVERLESIPLSISYSGGKDSTAVVALVLLMIDIGLLKKEDITILHSDTTIEFPLLTKSTFKVLDAINGCGIKTLVVTAPVEQRFFACLFAKGYPVPNYAVRWCTDYLKLRPQLRARKLLKDAYVLTGEHYGESSNRDKKLSSCGSNDCGQIEIQKSVSKEKMIRPIIDWRDCNVWDFIAVYGDKYLYNGLFNEISNVYEISNDEYKSGSLRTGCIGCPVIHTGRHYNTENKGVPSRLSLKLRLILEEMKNDNLRVRNPKKNRLKT
ncbi:phosphoadenosine phosphosulfate reductase family protein [Nostoc sp. KVJ3]|uniref:phosphoadenosine phosphosulfate reductase family protein n=1 Tax=Nostoc sp. KVJ3 TaxID=457945 RepID=UPI002238E5CE|nr:phosphoadenosine phosphosulfate reductase family protein [Nostoc sp. KVJ3]MCW5315624.1 phosphoadenosine phosphosulfate reductase family protein [Nostoc sp. KVJ3]